MARHTAAVCKLCRREGEKLFLKGKRCETPKCAITRKNYPPGLHGNKSGFGRKPSQYSKQLREKQKAKRTFGVLERQFRKYYKIAETKPGITGTNLLQILESRLDNVLYRSGFSESRAQGRQMIGHGLIKINGRKVKTASIMVKEGMVIQPTASASKGPLFTRLKGQKDKSPRWLKVDFSKPSIEIATMPGEDEVQPGIESQLIVELYSK